MVSSPAWPCSSPSSSLFWLQPRHGVENCWRSSPYRSRLFRQISMKVSCPVKCLGPIPGGWRMRKPSTLPGNSPPRSCSVRIRSLSWSTRSSANPEIQTTRGRCFSPQRSCAHGDDGGSRAPLRTARGVPRCGADPGALPSPLAPQPWSTILPPANQWIKPEPMRIRALLLPSWSPGRLLHQCRRPTAPADGGALASGGSAWCLFGRSVVRKVHRKRAAALARRA